MPQKLVGTACALAGALLVLGSSTSTAQVPGAGGREQLDFFESRIRPLLIQRCLDCHSEETEASGGLLLDSRDGWVEGGDSGPAIEAGKPDASLLWQAVSYEHAYLEMPPDGRLSEAERGDIRRWIEDGAVDPRRLEHHRDGAAEELPLEEADEHWAYQPLSSPRPPQTNQSSNAGASTSSSQHAGDAAERLVTESVSANSPIDQFIDAKLHEAGLEPAPEVDRRVLVRRAFYDLSGLPPTPAEVNAFLEDESPASYQRLIDRLLASPRFGEHFARRWMDVVRYADSITLRGFVLPEAWRYRDYLIKAYGEDRPFDLMMREQLAGDLYSAEQLSTRHPNGPDFRSVEQQQRRLIATGFLALGNTNLEQQDKSQLEMDVIDEQLEVIGRSFLGQTIGCARCHDHKFDPIPTADYYAMAGILRTAVTLEHSNVSQWLENPLPISEQRAEHFQQLARRSKQIESRIEEIKQVIDPADSDSSESIPIDTLSGIVVDSRQATTVGSWKVSSHVGRNVGGDYIHDENSGRGEKSATFEPRLVPPGRYEVRLAYSAAANRSSRVHVSVFSAEGEREVVVNQRQAPSEEEVWISLGKYRFEKDGQAFVLVSNRDTDGHVVLDAVQFLPLDDSLLARDSAENGGSGAEEGVGENQDIAQRRERQRLEKELEELEKELREVERRRARRPKYLAVVEQGTPRDIPIHVRGDVYNLAEEVPRGFLTALPNSRPKLEKQQSGRREFADWVVSHANPLTPRVYANRVWGWLMGQGLVTTPNNFGTTGRAPVHPELLDWLATRLLENQWSTKSLVREIMLSRAYRRGVIEADGRAARVDPNNDLYWRGHARRLPVEAFRDALLQISGELDTAMYGSLIADGTSADYDYGHGSTRRSVYHPVFRNSLPELFEVFDFADPSVSVGSRPRSTVPTQALTLMNHPWITDRVKQASERFAPGVDDGACSDEVCGKVVRDLYLHCFSRVPTEEELATCVDFLREGYDGDSTTLRPGRLQQLIRSLVSAVDFRYLD